MNIKEQLQFMALQEQMIALSVRVKILEKILLSKGTFAQEEYNKELSDEMVIVSEQLKPAAKALEELKKAIDEAKTKQEEQKTEDSK